MARLIDAAEDDRRAHTGGVPRHAPLVAASLCVLSFAALAAPRQTGDPAALVRHLYEVKRAEVAIWKAPPGAPERRAAFSATLAAFQAALSDGLAKAFEEDARRAEGGPGRFNADPLLWAQDFDADVLHDLQVDLLQRSGDRARVRARFTNSIVNRHGPVEVLFELRIEGERWRIEDIRSAGASLVQILSGP